MNPNSLYTSKDRKQPTNPYARKLDVEADLKPVAACLQAAGLTAEQLAKVRRTREVAPGDACGRGGAARHLWLGPPPHRPRCNAALLQVVAAHPALLSYCVEGRLQPFFEYLTGDLGLSQQVGGRAVGVLWSWLPGLLLVGSHCRPAARLPPGCLL